jgi:hypothetical protein
MRWLCALCRHEHRELIEHEIVAGNRSLREAAREYGVHYNQVHRHMSHHYPLGYDRALPPYRRLSAPASTDEAGAQITAVKRDDLSALEKARELHRRVDRVMECAEQLGNAGEILRAASELRRIVELEAKLTGEADHPRGPEIVVHLRKDFGGSDDDRVTYEELRYRQPQRVAAVPAGEDAVDAESQDPREVMQEGLAAAAVYGTVADQREVSPDSKPSSNITTSRAMSPAMS